MSAADMHNLDLTTPPVVKTIQGRSLVIGLIFSVAAIIGAFLQPDVFIRGYLVSFMAWLGVTLGSMAILMLRHMTGGGWGMVIRRIMGAAMRCIWLMAILFFPIGLMMKRLYIWAGPLDTVQDLKLRHHLEDITHTYLTVQGFWIRAVIYFAIWFLLIFFLTKLSKQQNQPPVRDTSSRFRKVAAPGLILYAFTISFAAIDWVMSLDPSWISTIYCLIFLAGQALSAVCFAVVIERILVRYKPMSELLRPDFVQDHGKLMLTFIMVWAYFAFSQWLIIWAGNLPEEITWYMRRLHGGWAGVGLFLVIFHFAVPFIFLLSRPFKRDVTQLVWLAVWLMLMRWLDILWHIEPDFSATFTVTWADIVIPIAMGGLWMALFCRNLNSMPLLPAYDLYAKEVLEPAHE
jgi:hypothetical protein